MTVGILTHMGLGDHLICNGLVRTLAGKFPHVTIYVKWHYLESVKYMFRDMKNLAIIGVDGDQDAWNRQAPITIRTGIFLGPEWNVTKCFCYSFYENAGLDRSLMHSAFHFERDLEREETFYNKAVEFIGTDKYIILHEDERFPPIKGVDETKFTVIRTSKFPLASECIFDWATLIERAQEYHGYDSSFAWMVEFLKLRPRETTFLHRYVRENNDPNTEEFERFTVIR